MEKLDVVVSVPKELQEVSVALVSLVSEVKKAAADGLQVADAIVIVSACAGKFMSAFDNWSKIAPEFKEDKLASEKCLALGLAEIASILV